ICHVANLDKFRELTDFRTGRNDRSFLYHDNAITDRMGVEITVFQVCSSFNPYIIPDATVLVEDCIFDVTVFANAYQWATLFLCTLNFVQRLVKTAPHHIRRLDSRSSADARTDADHRPLDLFASDNTAIGNYYFIQFGPRHFGRR